MTLSQCLSSLNLSFLIHKIMTTPSSEVVRIRRENTVEGACALSTVLSTLCGVHVLCCPRSFLVSHLFLCGSWACLFWLRPVRTGPWGTPIAALSEGASAAGGTKESDSIAISSGLSTPQGPSSPGLLLGGERVTFPQCSFLFKKNRIEFTTWAGGRSAL